MFLKDELDKLKRRERDALRVLAQLSKKLEQAPSDAAILREQTKYSKIALDTKAQLKAKKRAAKPKPVTAQKKWSPMLSGSFENGKRR